jgi:hypothetical protein
MTIGQGEARAMSVVVGLLLLCILFTALYALIRATRRACAADTKARQVSLGQRQRRHESCGPSPAK